MLWFWAGGRPCSNFLPSIVGAQNESDTPGASRITKIMVPCSLGLHIRDWDVLGSIFPGPDPLDDVDGDELGT